MFATIKQIFNPKNKDLQKKILFTLFALFVFKFGTTLVVPGIPRESLGTDELGVLDLVNVLGGGALESFSIFALGVMPYITASIVMQFLQMDIIPYFSELSKQGGVGRAKLNQITRVIGIVFAFIQGYMFSVAMIPGGSVMDYMTFALVLTAGTAFLLWLGDMISKKGIGNGISMIILAGIVSSLPTMFIDAYNAFVIAGDLQQVIFGVAAFVMFVLVYFAIIVGIVFVELSERRIPIQYANKSTSSNNKSYIPFKLNSAGVMPVIFASFFISAPTFIAQIFNNEAITLFVNKWISYESTTGLILYVLLIFGFALFYVKFQIKPKELSTNLQKNGGFIPGYRPGVETEKYISKTLSRITVVGATLLVVLAALPILFNLFTSLPTSVTIGGTGLLIAVGVSLETFKQVESSLVTRTYSNRSRGRRRY